MDGGGLNCPVEECDKNRGGYCGIREEGPLGWAAAAYYAPGMSNFMAPFGPAYGMIINNSLSNTMAEGQSPAADSPGMWRNCPRRKAIDQRK